MDALHDKENSYGGSGAKDDAYVLQLRHALEEARHELADRDVRLLRADDALQDMYDASATKQAQVDEAFTAYMLQMEELTQANHGLLQELRAKEHALGALQDLEAEYARSEEEHAVMKKGYVELQRRADRAEHDVGRLRDAMQQAVEERNLQLDQAAERIAHLERDNARLQTASEEQLFSADMSEEMQTLRMQMHDAQRELAKTQLEHTMLANALASADLRVDLLQKTAARLQDEKEQSEGALYELSQRFSETRKTNTELSEQLDALRQQFASGGRQAGTSLFSEVEDKRIALENECATLRRKVAQLQNTVKMGALREKEHMARVQMLMQARGSKADAAKMAQLEESLSQKSSELATLTNKFTRLERHNRDLEEQLQSKLLASGTGDRQLFITTLGDNLTRARQDIDALKRELQTKTMLQLNDSNKLSECHRQLHTKNTKIEGLEADLMKLRQKLELQQIYGAENMEPAGHTTAITAPRQQPLAAAAATTTTTTITTARTVNVAPTSVPPARRPLPTPASADLSSSSSVLEDSCCVTECASEENNETTFLPQQLANSSYVDTNDSPSSDGEQHDSNEPDCSMNVTVSMVETSMLPSEEPATKRKRVVNVSSAAPTSQQAEECKVQ